MYRLQELSPSCRDNSGETHGAAVHRHSLGRLNTILYIVVDHVYAHAGGAYMRVWRNMGGLMGT